MYCHNHTHTHTHAYTYTNTHTHARTHTDKLTHEQHAHTRMKPRRLSLAASTGGGQTSNTTERMHEGGDLSGELRKSEEEEDNMGGGVFKSTMSSLKSQSLNLTSFF